MKLDSGFFAGIEITRIEHIKLHRAPRFSLECYQRIGVERENEKIAYASTLFKLNSLENFYYENGSRLLNNHGMYGLYLIS